jgi:hypothetical protein
MEKDLEILHKILTGLYADKYANMLLKHIEEKFNSSDLSEITPNFLYYNLVYELGKKEASNISDYFTQTKEKGYYETELDKLLKNKSHF